MVTWEKKLGYAISRDSDSFLTPPFSFPVSSGITEQKKLNMILQLSTKIGQLTLILLMWRIG